MQLIADSGSTKCEWCWFTESGTIKKTITTGISPYFLTAQQIQDLLKKELLPKLKDFIPSSIHFYGTGMSASANKQMLKKVLRSVFPKSSVDVETDLLGAAKALCGDEKGIACILGTGCNSAYYNGIKVVKNSPGLGFILGDEGSGAYLGKKLVQYYLYDVLDKDLKDAFNETYKTNAAEILDHVYRKEKPNRYLAAFTLFLAKHRGHYMIENIIEDGLNDFFFTHVNSYKESASLPIYFTGSVAYGFKDVLKTLCANYDMQLGNVIKQPMKGLIQYHLHH